VKAALIPPISQLHTFGRGQFHLLLSHLLPDKTYYDHYADQRRLGAYLVLDNSAHENGEGDDCEALMYNALALNCQEVVVPDVLFDFPGTVERSTEALETWFEDQYAAIKITSPALMYVPQGETENAWAMCLGELVRLHLFVAKRHGYRKDFVIGLSKDYEMWDGGLMYLIEEYIIPLFDDLRRQGVHPKLHMLGWGRELWELEKIAKRHPWIRSTDSAKPFVYGLNHINLADHWESDPPQYPKRPPNYFAKRMGSSQVLTSKINCVIFKAMASGDRHNTVIV